MFPLGSVVVPGMLLPLRVFEPRYRTMMADCMAGDRTFGVVLIERGSEVGGGDMRTDVGTLTRVVRAEEQADGQWAVAALGTGRIKVDHWLPDDPYPRAETRGWPDQAGPGAEVPDDVVPLLRRAAALARELNMTSAPIDLELDDDPLIASYQATVSAPLGPADRQNLLAAPTVEERWTLLRTLVNDQIELLQAQLSHGS
jgi:hypothetical protein